MRHISKIILCFFIALLCFPWSNFAAEILQVRSSTKLQIGDSNKGYLENIILQDEQFLS